MGLYNSTIKPVTMAGGWEAVIINVPSPEDGTPMSCYIIPVVRGVAGKERLCWDVTINGSKVPTVDSLLGPLSAFKNAISLIEDFAINVELGYANINKESIRDGLIQRTDDAKELANDIVKREMDRLHTWQGKILSEDKT